MTRTLNLSDLYLSGTTESFYLNDGESVEWIKDNGDGTAVVRINFPRGMSDVIDADVKASATTPEAGERHADADTMPVAIERSDAIDAAAALALMARENRRAAKLRANAGPGNASHRAWLRDSADTYEAAARRVQRAADEAGR